MRPRAGGQRQSKSIFGMEIGSIFKNVIRQY